MSYVSTMTITAESESAFEQEAIKFLRNRGYDVKPAYQQWETSKEFTSRLHIAYMTLSRKLANPNRPNVLVERTKTGRLVSLCSNDNFDAFCLERKKFRGVRYMRTKSLIIALVTMVTIHVYANNAYGGRRHQNRTWPRTTATPLPAPKPTATATPLPATTDHYTLGWNASSTTGVYYRVYYGHSPDEMTIKIDAGKGLIWTIPNTRDGQTYFAVVKAYLGDNIGDKESGPSNRVSWVMKP